MECPSCARLSPVDARFCAGCGHGFGAEDSLGETDGAADPLIGRTIAERYRIEELIGRGGMGVVYRVEHVRMGKLMAMKLLSGALAREKEVVKRFKREAEAVSRLDHAHTVQVFDFGQSQGMTYLVMEYLSGRDLGEVVKEDGPLPFARVARIGAQICASVQQAHDLGIVHRDLKPENVMVLEDRGSPDYVKVLDFGLAKLRDTEEHGDKSITRAGSILGTPYYMAPEHIRGEAVDARSDVYAMGALMYKALTGLPPFYATTPMGVLTMHLTDDPVPPSERVAGLDIPEEADRILLKAIEKSPADRYESMAALRADLVAYLEHIGEAPGLEASTTGGVVPSRSGRQRKVATRSDVDDFERRLRRGRLVRSTGSLLLMAALVAAGVWAVMTRPVGASTTEGEPNDELVTANLLPEDTAVTAFLGRRLDDSRSDADVYVLRDARRERRAIRVEVSAIPNMDIVIELYREGITTPVLLADSGGIGQAERVPNFPIEGPVHYLRVRELWESGALPTENVSDPYTIVWRHVVPLEGEEREINDSLELAEELRLDAPRRGYVGWGRDQDTYCVAEDVRGVRARLEPVSSLDLVLEQIDRTTGRVRRYDEGRVGAGEVSAATVEAGRGDLCFEVSARRPKEGLGNDPDRAYVLHLEAAPAEESSAEETQSAAP